MKYLGTNLTKKVKDLFTENYKTLIIRLKTQMNGKIQCLLISIQHSGN